MVFSAVGLGIHKSGSLPAPLWKYSLLWLLLIVRDLSVLSSFQRVRFAVTDFSKASLLSAVLTLTTTSQAPSSCSVGVPFAPMVLLSWDGAKPLVWSLSFLHSTLSAVSIHSLHGARPSVFGMLSFPSTLV